MKKSIVLLFATMSLFLCMCSCDVELFPISYGDEPHSSKRSAAIDTALTVTDIDGNVYNTVVIGGQTWTTENLRVAHYNDGTLIPVVTNPLTWATQIDGACCNYNNRAGMDTTYGKLYNWYAVDTKKLAPEGWHVPTLDELETLATNINSTAFNKIVGGYRKFDGEFLGLTSGDYFWTSEDDDNPNYAWARTSPVPDIIRSLGVNKKDGLSVRLIKD